jgi:glutamate/tyrosine decarboxylase-like PLP-dependent enzyme
MDNTNLFDESFKKIRNFLQNQEKEDQSIVKFRNPSELSKSINYQISPNGVSEDEFLGLIDHYLEFSVRTADKQFLNQLYSGFNLPAFIGELLTIATNTSMSTYEVAPVATLIEKEMISLMNSYAGYSDGEGIFVSGGSNGNLIAMFSARNRIFPEGSFTGYNSEQPIFVVATCATTLMGAYDPIEEMAEICERHNIWLHADGAFGGSLLLSEEHRHLLKGLERTDSFVWDPHKIMNIPLICSALLIKEKGTLKNNITDINTDYLYHHFIQPI